MRKLIVLGVVLAIIMSCQKDEEPTGDPTYLKSEYLPMEIGNYWVYQHFRIDSSGNESPVKFWKTDSSGNETFVNKMDSAVITRDTLINGQKYAVMEGTSDAFNIQSNQWGILGIYRDSAGCLVDKFGKILFTENNFSDTLYTFIERYDMEDKSSDTVSITYYKMEYQLDLVTVPAGTFEVLNRKGKIVYDESVGALINPRYYNTYYGKNVGKILSTYFYYNSPTTYEKRLLRYHVQLQKK